MKTKKDELRGFDFDNVRNLFTTLLEESISALNGDKEYLKWYETCTFDDYFANNLEEIWENDEYVGDGFRSLGIIVTEKNKQQLENIFESVRDEVYKEALEELEEEFEEE